MIHGALPKQGMLVIKTQRTYVFLTHQEIDGCFAVSDFNTPPQFSNHTKNNQEQDDSL